MSTRLLVVGWDGATDSHLQSFDLPFFDALDHGDTLLPEPFWQRREVDSGAAWTTITTGKSMWDHEVVSLSGRLRRPRLLDWIAKFDRFVPRSFMDRPARIWLRKVALGDQPTNDGIEYKRVWHYVPNSLAFTVPLTHPPKPTDGVTVSGFPAPEIGVYPPELEPDVRNRYDGEPAREFGNPSSKQVRAGYVEELFETHAAERETILWLNEERSFEFQFLTFTLLDRLLHVVDENDERISRAYRTLDETTAELVDRIQPDDVLVLSDHGMKYAPRYYWQHIHDETSGIWAGTRDFDLETHLDVTPAICEYYDVDMTDTTYAPPTQDVDTGEMRNHLEELGYL